MKRLIIAAALVCFISVSATNGSKQIGYGVKSKGMGGVGIAFPQDSFAIAANPAGLVMLCDRFDVGLHWLEHRSRHKEKGALTPFHQMGKSREDLFWPEGGIVWRNCPNQAFGLAAFVNSQWEVETFGSDKVKRGMEYGQFFITPGWAYQITPCHQVGIAVNVAVGRMRVTNNPLDPSDSVAAAYGKIFLSNQGYDYEWGVSARIGWIGTFYRCLQLGITYQTPTYMSPFRKYRGFIPGGGDAKMPAELGIGLAWRPLSNIVGSIDVVHIFWRDGRLFRNPYNNEAALFGASEGPGFGWNNQTVFKFGVAWDVFSCFTLRLGYNYGNAVIPPGNPLNAFNMEAVEDHITAGGTFRWGCNELSLSYVYGFRHTVSGRIYQGDTHLNDRARQHSVGLAYARRF